MLTNLDRSEFWLIRSDQISSGSVTILGSAGLAGSKLSASASFRAMVITADSNDSKSGKSGQGKKGRSRIERIGSLFSPLK